MKQTYFTPIKLRIRSFAAKAVGVTGKKSYLRTPEALNQSSQNNLIISISVGDLVATIKSRFTTVLNNIV